MIELHSNTFVPAHTIPESRDDRKLGLCVSRLHIDGDDVALDGPADLPTVWREAELAGKTFARRWTRGAAMLPAGTRLVVVDLAGDGYCWRGP